MSSELEEKKQRGYQTRKNNKNIQKRAKVVMTHSVTWLLKNILPTHHILEDKKKEKK